MRTCGSPTAARSLPAWSDRSARSVRRRIFAGTADAAIGDDLLARFGLADAAERRVATYSGGMRRRLDIAMSLIGDAPVLVLDEPTTGLDPQSRIEVWTIVKHLADRIAILHEGRILVEGTLAELKGLLPPATVEYVEKQPTLEEVFLALVTPRESL